MKDNFSFIDEVLEELLFGGHDDEHKAITDSKQQLISGFKAAMLEVVTTNQKGQFEDDAGNICWYLDDLVKALETLVEGGSNGK